KSAQADLDARKAQYRVAQGAFSPVIDLEIDKTWDDNIDTNDWKNEIEAMVRFRFNLLNGGKDNARKTETLHLVCESRAIRDNTHRQVVESIRLSWMAYQSAQKKISLLKKYVESTGATAEAYTKQWNIGKRTMLDVLDTKAEFINAKKDLTHAIYDSLYAQCRILSGTGSLVHSLDLQWPDDNNLKKDAKKNKESLKNNG
ncbi:MAG: TolC family protein, partial [Desulfobulbaceae bacterium]|nr:TolC family protein [Desulfobulbaceae bacterium]